MDPTNPLLRSLVHGDHILGAMGVLAAHVDQAADLGADLRDLLRPDHRVEVASIISAAQYACMAAFDALGESLPVEVTS